MTAALVGLTISVRPVTVIASGVRKENLSCAVVLRGVFQSTFPVALFNATRKGLLAPSQPITSALPTRIGEQPLPCTGGYFNEVLRHRTFPFESSAAVPYWPK